MNPGTFEPSDPRTFGPSNRLEPPEPLELLELPELLTLLTP